MGTPGVYINEPSRPFGSGVAPVETANPVFVGYTETAIDPRNGKSLAGSPVRISSLAWFEHYFGGPAVQPFAVARIQADPGYTLALGSADFRFELYWQILLYFTNGGRNCYIVSCGSYDDRLAAEALIAGITAAADSAGPTMVAVPEACQLPLAGGSYARVARAMLSQAATLRDRIAILDLPGCRTADTPVAVERAKQDFIAAVSPTEDLTSYAVAYAPALVTHVVQPRDIPYDSFVSPDGDNSAMNAVLTEELFVIHRTDTPTLVAIESVIATLFPAAPHSTLRISTNAGPAMAPTAVLDRLLAEKLPVYRRMKQQAAQACSIVSPCGAIAGAWADTDAVKGVWTAPADIALQGIAGTLCAWGGDQWSASDSEADNRPVNLILAQPGRGVLVSGADTLDAMGSDFRRIAARRTAIYIEQSIKTALQALVFEPNQQETWGKAVASISEFLRGLWAEGALIGATASDAFSVQCGQGTTMTPQDILDGEMVVAVNVRLTTQVEFIVLTFKQAMAGAAVTPS
jgi:hypothetical protein